MYRVKFSRRAADGLYDSISYYEDAKAGLGEEFRKQLLQRVTIFQLMPFQGSKHTLTDGQEIRITPFPSHVKPKFKHVIIFKVDEGPREVVILSIPHTSTNWKAEILGD